MVDTVTDTHTIDLCDGFVKVGEATACDFRAVIRHLAVGEWELTAPLSGLQIEADSLDGIDSVLVWDDEPEPRIVFSGLVRRLGGVDGGTVRTVDPGGTVLTFSGVDSFGLLGQRSVWPTPSEAPPWTDSHDERTGPGSTVAAEFIAYNLGSSAMAARQVPNVTIIDPGIGDVSTWSGRLQPLHEFIGRICRESGISLRVTMPTPGAFQFEFASPADYSNRLLFTDQGDLEALSRLLTPATASHIVAAGQGELTARSFRVADSGAEGLERVEYVYENTNITTTSGLLRAAETELVLNGTDATVDGTIAAGATQRIRYLDDYRLGDYLGVEVDEVRYVSQVESVRFDFTKDRQLVSPVLGRSSTSAVDTLVRHVDDLSTRFDSQIA